MKAASFEFEWHPFFEFDFQNVDSMRSLIRGNVFLFAVLLVLVNCKGDSGSGGIKQQNKERFSDRNQSREANFLVNAINVSHTISQIAELGEQRLADSFSKATAHEIMEAQSEISVKLKTFAESNDMAVPLTAPENAGPPVSELNELEGEKFRKEWNKQMKIHHQRLVNDLSRYRKKSSQSLRTILDSTIVLMEANKARILALSEMEKE